MILVDTSAWVAFLQADGSPADRALTALLADGTTLWTTATVVTELLAGADDEAAAHRMEDLVGSLERCAPPDLADLRHAGRLFRAIKHSDARSASLSAAVVAAVALRDQLTVLTADPAFRAMARHGGPNLHPLDTAEAPPDRAVPTSPIEPQARPVTVLVVEDEPSDARMLENALERPNRRIVVATTAKMARQRIADATPDLIVLDLVLPDEDGRRLLSDLRRDPDANDVGVVVVTGMAGPRTREECFGLGADEFFDKPFDATALADVVENLLTEGRPDAPDPDPLGHPHTLSEVQKLLAARHAAENVTTPWTVALLELDTDPQGTGSPASEEEDGPVATPPLLPRLLRTAIATLSGALDSCDLVARWGVDELVVVSPDKDEEEMRRLVDRLVALPEVAPYLDSSVRRVGRSEDLLDAVAAMARELTGRNGRIPPPPGSPSTQSSPSGPAREPEARRSRPNAILVEDDPVTAGLVRHRLGRSGFHVVHHDDGADALEAILATPPDVVVLDVQLPSMDGFEILGRLREDSVARDVPVLMLTSLGRQEHVQRGFELGANDYVTKPFSPTELLTRVLRLVRRR